MKKAFWIAFFLITVTASGSAQSIKKYDTVYSYGVFHKDWALVKSIAGFYGFIDKNEKEIIPAIYDKIYKLKENNGKYAMIRSVADTYGFIDQNGKLVVEAIYFSKDEAIQKLNATL